jgi:hypothetical protein
LHASESEPVKPQLDTERIDTASGTTLRTSATSLIAPIALTLTFIVTRLVAVMATAPGLPIAISAAAAPLVLLGHPASTDLAGDHAASRGSSHCSARLCPRRAEDLLLDLALCRADDLLLMLRHCALSSSCNRARALSPRPRLIGLDRLCEIE